MPRVIAIDTETERIAPGNIIPKMICLSAYGENRKGKLESRLWGNHPEDGVEAVLEGLLADTDTLLVTHNGAYDYAVIARSYPDLIPLVFERIASLDFCTDTQYRELLLNLSTTGKLDKYALPNGQKGQIQYGLADLEKKYLGIDRSQQKEDLENSWRINYSVLDGWKAEDYPEDAAQYARDDPKGTYEVYWAQEESKKVPPHPVTNTEGFQVWKAFSLFLMTAWGIKVNKKNAEHMRDHVEPVIAANRDLLIECGIMQPGRPSQPYATQIKRAYEMLAKLTKGKFNAERDGWQKHREFLEGQGIKFTATKKDVIKQEPLRARAEAIYKAIGEEPDYTETGQISLADPAPTLLGAYDEVFAQYAARQELIKLTTHHIPLLLENEYVYFNYRVLVETGRTSSYGNKKGKPALYPATNGQNIPGLEIGGIDVRQGYEPRPGTVFFDVDATNLELATSGQTCLDLFGESKILELYNAGIDLHGYTASYLLVEVGGVGIAREFVQACRAEGILSDRMAVYEAFMECKKHEDKEVREKLYKHWRTYAKPVNLGFPGGLGPATMVAFSKTTYDVDMTEDQAREAREVWRQAFPEMPKFHKWINGQTDEWNSHGEKVLYQYTTGMGMVRKGASYCAAANGKCMQSPGAETMTLANNMVVRECYDPSRESILLGCRPIAFVHDQIIGEVTPGDEHLWHDQVMRVRALIIKAAKRTLPNVKFRCDEAHLTAAWSKKSEPTFDDNGRLIPWKPK